jgi:hypothetical protein
MRNDVPEEEEQAEEPAGDEPPPKQWKLMADAMPKKAATPSKAKPAAAATKPKSKPIGNISAAEKNKAPVPERTDDDDEAIVLKKLRPRLPKHDDSHPEAENMKERKDKGLRKWRESDPYFVRRRTAVDYRFHTRG